MKRLFIAQLFYAVAETITGAGSTPVLTSPKLDELRAAYKAAWKESTKFEDPFTQEAKDANLKLWKIGGEIKAEENNLQKAANEAKTAEMRNERLKLNQSQFDAYDQYLAVKADKKATPEALAAAETNYKTARELVDNELLAKYAGSKSAKPASENGTATTSANKEAILQLARDGKTKKEIEEAGYARSTVWHTVNNAKKAGETFPNA